MYDDCALPMYYYVGTNNTLKYVLLLFVPVNKRKNEHN